MELPDFEVMTADERKAWRQAHEAENARLNKLVIDNANCPYCQSMKGTPCKPTRWARHTDKKVSPHQARKDAWRDAGKPGQHVG